MAIKLTQGLKQTQNLMMTPQLQQAIKLLTLTHLEMSNMISAEMVENPMLEEMDGGEDRSSSDDVAESALEAATKEVEASNFDEATVVEKDDFDWNSYVESYNSNSSQAPNMRESFDQEEGPNYENIVSKGQDLAEHLEWQLRMDNLEEKEMAIANFIIHCLAPTGYIEGDYQELVSKSGFHFDEVEEMRLYIQKMDPVGCGSLDLVDCLLSQARAMEERSVLLEKIIRHHWPRSPN